MTLRFKENSIHIILRVLGYREQKYICTVRKKANGDSIMR